MKGDGSWKNAGSTPRPGYVREGTRDSGASFEKRSGRGPITSWRVRCRLSEVDHIRFKLVVVNSTSLGLSDAQAGPYC